jgi:hypothetical protein
MKHSQGKRALICESRAGSPRFLWLMLQQVRKKPPKGCEVRPIDRLRVGNCYPEFMANTTAKQMLENSLTAIRCVGKIAPIDAKFFGGSVHSELSLRVAVKDFEQASKLTRPAWLTPLLIVSSWFVGNCFANSCHDAQGAPVPHVTVSFSGSSKPGLPPALSVPARVWSGWLVKNQSDFLKESLQDWITLAKTCSEQLPDTEITKLQVFTSQKDADRTLIPPKSPHDDFAAWRRMYDVYQREPMAQVILFGKTVVTAYRVADDQHPTEFYQDSFRRSTEYEVVDITVQKYESGPLRDPDGHVTLFLKSNTRLSPNDASEIARGATNTIHFPNLSVEIRPDRWFIEALTFPIADRSQEVSDRNYYVKPPVPTSYSPSDRLVCHRQHGGGFSCLVP